MSIHIPQNFYRQTIAQDWPVGTGNFYVSVKPTVSEGYITISPSSTSLREIVFFSATGTDGTGDYVTISTGGRGLGGTTEQTHIIGETVRMNVSAENLQEISDDIDAIVAAGSPDASTITKGIVKLNTAAASATEPIVVGINDPLLMPITFDNYPLSATEFLGAWSSDVWGAFCQTTASAKQIEFMGVSLPVQSRVITDDWAQADGIICAGLLGSYFYALAYDTGTTSARMYRYDKTNLAGGGTNMTIAGQTFGAGYNFRFVIGGDGNFYCSKQAGNDETNVHKISKYTLSGTTLTYVSTVTCGSTAGYFEMFPLVDSGGNMYGWNYSTDYIIRKYNSSGTLIKTYSRAYGDQSACFNGYLYLRESGIGQETYSRVNL